MLFIEHRNNETDHDPLWLNQCATATAALPGGTAVAVLSGGNRVTGQVAPGEQVAHVGAPVRNQQRQVQHLVEIAIVDKPAPVNTDLITAHQGVAIIGSVIVT